MNIAITLTVNGKQQQVTVKPTDMLLDVLRDHLGYVGSNKVCTQGICGACTIIMDGKAMTSCLLLAVQADGAEIRTVEGLETGDRLDSLQEAFIHSGAVQCGFCTPGFLMAARALLMRIRDRRATKSLMRCAAIFAAVPATQRSLRLLLRLPLIRSELSSASYEMNELIVSKNWVGLSSGGQCPHSFISIICAWRTFFPIIPFNAGGVA